MKNVILSIVILLLLIAGCIVEYWNDKKNNETLLSTFDSAWLIAATAAILLALAIIVPKAYGHDHARPELNPWLESLRGRGGAHCCDDKDTTHVDDLDWGTQDKDFQPPFGPPTQRSHFWVNIEGKKYDVPDSALVDGPNKEGHALVWYIKAWDSGADYHFIVRCFMPGTMS